jgi:hypothetical protein
MRLQKIYHQHPFPMSTPTEQMIKAGIALRDYVHVELCPEGCMACEVNRRLIKEWDDALSALRSPAKEEEPMETSMILGHAWVAQGINGMWMCSNCGQTGGNGTAPFNSLPCFPAHTPKAVKKGLNIKSKKNTR